MREEPESEWILYVHPLHSDHVARHLGHTLAEAHTPVVHRQGCRVQVVTIDTCKYTSALLDWSLVRENTSVILLLTVPIQQVYMSFLSVSNRMVHYDVYVKLYAYIMSG